MSTFPSLAGKTVFVVTHALNRTGAPMLLLETAKRMQASGVHLMMTSMKEDLLRNYAVDRSGIKLVEFEYSFFEASKADMVIANTALCKTWVKIFLDRFPNAGKKLIWWLHEISPNEPYIQDQLYGDGLVYLDQVQCALFDSENSKRQWENSNIALPAKVRVVHPFVSNVFINTASKNKLIFPVGKWLGCLQRKSYLNRKQIRQRLGLSDQDFLITLIGSYSEKKGQALLAETINQMTREHPKLPLKLLLVGFWKNDSRRRFLNTYGSSAISGKRTFLNVEDLHCFYRASDCFVLNSQFHGECFGRVTVEAMAHKLPILGTHAGGTREIVEDGVTGLLYPLGKDGQKTLKEHILVLYGDRAKAAEFGQAGFGRVKRLFGEERFYSEFHEAIWASVDEENC